MTRWMLIHGDDRQSFPTEQAALAAAQAKIEQAAESGDGPGELAIACLTHSIECFPRGPYGVRHEMARVQ